MAESSYQCSMNKKHFRKIYGDHANVTYCCNEPMIKIRGSASPAAALLAPQGRLPAVLQERPPAKDQG